MSGAQFVFIFGELIILFIVLDWVIHSLIISLPIAEKWWGHGVTVVMFRMIYQHHKFISNIFSANSSSRSCWSYVEMYHITKLKFDDTTYQRPKDAEYETKGWTRRHGPRNEASDQLHIWRQTVAGVKIDTIHHYILMRYTSCTPPIISAITSDLILEWITHFCRTPWNCSIGSVWSSRRKNDRICHFVRNFADPT